MKSFSECKRIVVKIGTSSLTYDTGRFNLDRIETLVRTLCDFRNSGREIILVSSGSITAGIARLGLGHRPHSLEERQAMAAVGQCELMRIYERFFDMYGYPVGQVLLTANTMLNPQSKKNAENTFNTLISLGCIPVVNENDTVSCDEIKEVETFGDNDTLSAHVAVITSADALVILSDINGLYDSDPRKNPDARLISRVERIDEKIIGYGGGAGSERGTGGVAAKLRAGQLACTHGIPMYLVNGSDPRILYSLNKNENPGTVFLPYEE